MREPWPADRTERLRRLLRSGVTDAAIAEAFGISLRAVIGKRQRLGFFRRINRERPGEPPQAVAQAPAP